MKKYDLVVIGTGVAGASVAHKCRQAGWSVAIVDKRPFGGTCASRGCDAKKVLASAAKVIDHLWRMEGKGLTQGSSINWKELIDFKRTFTDPVPQKREESFKKAGIDGYHGIASFVSENEIKVNDEILEGKHFLIATGAKAVSLGIEGEELAYISDDFLEMDFLPDTIVFIGGGYISFEFAHIAARAGAKVHIIHNGADPLKNFDQELVELLLQRSKEVGIEVHLNTQVESIAKNDSNYIVKGKKEGKPTKWECGRVIKAAGRVPDIEELALEKAKVRADKKGIIVNEFLQSTTNPLVYAAGDVSATKGLPLTPVASLEAGVVAENLLKGNHKKPDYSVIASVVFSEPKLALIGLTEDRAQKEGYEIVVNKFETSSWYTYRHTNEKYALVKTVIDKHNNRLLGAHVLGSNADELINYFAIIMKFSLPFEEVKKVMFAYPTSASDLSYLL